MSSAISVAPCENVSSGICGQRRPRSACASAQSDQGLPCPLTESLDPTECMNVEQMARMILCTYAGWSESARVCACSKALFAWCSPYVKYMYRINPFMPSGLFYLKSLDRSICYIRGARLVFIIAMFCRNFWTYHKHCRPWSDAAYRGVWSGSTVFVNVPFMGR